MRRFFPEKLMLAEYSKECCWQNTVKNEWFLRETTLRPITCIVRQRQLRLHGLALLPEADSLTWLPLLRTTLSGDQGDVRKSWGWSKSVYPLVRFSGWIGALRGDLLVGTPLLVTDGGSCNAPLDVCSLSMIPFPDQCFCYAHNCRIHLQNIRKVNVGGAFCDSYLTTLNW